MEDPAHLAEVTLAAFWKEDTSTRLTELRKVHAQLGLPSRDQFVDFLQSAGLEPEFIQKASEIALDCPIRAHFTQPPPRPIAALPTTTDINQVVRIDLAFIDGVPLCHMVDAHSRCSAGSALPDKTGKSVVASIFRDWLQWNGPPQQLIADCGSEFLNADVDALCDSYGIKLLTVPTKAHWSHGLVERHHKVVTATCDRLRAMHPTLDLDILWRMAIHAKNCLHNNKGYSPFQIHRGRNPDLPSLRDLSTFPAEVREQAKTVKVMYDARRAFLKAESRDMLARSLRSNKRQGGTPVQVGQEVQYHVTPSRKHPQDAGWHGPATVLYKEGVMVYLRHGKKFYRAHQLEVRPLGDEFLEHWLPRFRSEGHTVPPPPPEDERDRQDWFLRDGIFHQLHTLFGPFQVEAFCDNSMHNKHELVPEGWCPKNSAMSKVWAGRRIYGSPPFEYTFVLKVLEKALAEFAKDPSQSRFVFVLPDFLWTHSGLQSLLAGFQHLALIPAGKRVFLAQGRQDKGPTRWATHIIGLGVTGFRGDAPLEPEPIPEPGANWEPGDPAPQDFPDPEASPIAGHLEVVPLGAPKPSIEDDAHSQGTISDVGSEEFQGNRQQEVLGDHWPTRGQDLRPGWKRVQDSIAKSKDADPAVATLALFCNDLGICPCDLEDPIFLAGLQEGGTSSATSSLLSEAQGNKGKVQGKKKFKKGTPNPHHPDPHHFTEAKTKELASLEKFETFKLVDLLPEMHVLSSRWVLKDKPPLIGSDTPRPKARLCIRGFQELDLEGLDTFAPTASRASWRAVTCAMVNRGWVPKTVDVKNAFLQGEPLDRDVFMSLPKDVSLPPGKVWKLLKPLYGLGDASQRWHTKAKGIFVGKLKGVQSRVDPAVFIWSKDGVTIGVLSAHVDDFYFGGTPEWEKFFLENLTREVEVGEVEVGTFRYAGLDVRTTVTEKGGVHVTADLNDYVKRLTPIIIPDHRNPDSVMLPRELTSYRGLLGGMLWSGTQIDPGSSFNIAELAGHTGDPRVKHLEMANRELARLQKDPLTLNFQPLSGKLKITLFTDASWGNLTKGGSQGGAFTVLAEDKEGGRFNPLQWTSRRLRRNVQSTFGAETLALVNGVDDGLCVAYLVDEINSNLPRQAGSKPSPVDMIVRDGAFSPIPFDAVVDCKSVFDYLTTSGKGVSEKRLLIDLWSLKEDLKRRSIRTIGWCLSENQLADCLTKAMSRRLLHAVLNNGVLPPVERVSS
jgi:hypothetical protein